MEWHISTEQPTVCMTMLLKWWGLLLCKGCSRAQRTNNLSGESMKAHRWEVRVGALHDQPGVHGTGGIHGTGFYNISKLHLVSLYLTIFLN